MTYQWLFPAVKQPTVTFLLDRSQLASPRLPEQLAALDRQNRAVVLDRHKEKITVVCKTGDDPKNVFDLAGSWGWVREVAKLN